MIEKTINIRKLYKDATYFHLLHEGHSIKQAELTIEKLFEN